MTIVTGICACFVGLAHAFPIITKPITDLARASNGEPTTANPGWAALPWAAAHVVLGAIAIIAGWRMVQGHARHRPRLLRAAAFVALATSAAWITLTLLGHPLWDDTTRSPLLVPCAVAALQACALAWPHTR